MRTDCPSLNGLEIKVGEGENPVQTKTHAQQYLASKNNSLWEMYIEKKEAI